MRDHLTFMESILLDNNGKECMQRGDHVEALGVLHRSLKLKIWNFRGSDRRIAVTTLLLAETYLKRKRFDDALEYCMITMRIRDSCDEYTDDRELLYAVKCLRNILKEIKRKCAVCGRKCNHVCLTCRCHWYCSRKHQKIHWKSRHRVNCKDKLFIEHVAYSRS